MKNHHYFKIFMVFLVILHVNSSCNQPEETKNDPSSAFIFEYTYSCGWCGGSQILTINGSKAVYNAPAICDIPSHYSSKDLSDSELEQLQLETLKALIEPLNIDECGVCYDGCDETLKFIVDSDEHYIRFTSTDSIPQLENLMDNIIKLTNEMKALSNF